MRDFFAWVQSGDFDKPREADDSYTSRLQNHNRTMLETIEKITGQRPKKDAPKPIQKLNENL